MPDWVPGTDLQVDPQLHVGVGLGHVRLEQGQLDRRTECGCGHRHRDVAAQVGAVAGEHRVGRHVDLDVEVPGGSTARADLALVGELDTGAGVHACRDLHGDRPARADASVAGALAAGLGDDLAVATAGGTGAEGADLAEERALDLLHLAATVAGLAGHRARSRCGTAAAADVAQDGGVDLQLTGDPEGRLGELDLEPHERVLAATGARTRSTALGAAGTLAAEEGVHDVGEREPSSLARTAATERISAQVVHPALLGVGEDVVGGGDLLEPVLGRGVGVHVGVQLTGETAVRLLDLGRVSVPGHTEDLVGVLAHVSSFGWGFGGSVRVSIWGSSWVMPCRGSWRRSWRPRVRRPSIPGSPCGWVPRCQGNQPPPHRGRSRSRPPRWLRAPRMGPRGRSAR